MLMVSVFALFKVPNCFSSFSSIFLQTRISFLIRNENENKIRVFVVLIHAEHSNFTTGLN